MNKRPILYSKQQRKHIIQLSPRFIKRNQHIGRELLGQVSAQINQTKPKAKQIRLQSPFSLHKKLQVLKLNQPKHILTQQEIRNSSTYLMLEQKLRKQSSKLQQEIDKLRKVKEDRMKQHDLLNKEQFNTKLQIWEFKNKVLSIKGDIQAEQNQIQNLVEQLRPYDSQDDGEQDMGRSAVQEESGGQMEGNRSST